jgi:hypothetical protein
VAGVGESTMENEAGQGWPSSCEAGVAGGAGTPVSGGARDASGEWGLETRE